MVVFKNEDYIADCDTTKKEDIAERPNNIIKKINRFIRLKQIDCFNQQENNNVQNIFKVDSTYLESDVDEQLMISIPFTQHVKLHSIRIIPRDNNKTKVKKELLFIQNNIKGEDTTAFKELILYGSPAEQLKSSFIEGKNPF
ncbi:DUF1000-domain-containing protein [Gigaspora margarita]|uniref:DUF1000-domain-containing protein n=1 Tax=Gigaspora margarita TaxID=4874 RepID=A0A8H4EQR2_GIGMA|nr:DUF1000-domain-containing protein [Gigaspora margarita]